MVLINDKKFACATCIKGHRVSGCTHTDRPLFEVKKKGRPTTQCQCCKDRRKVAGSSVHNKCVCGDSASKPAPITVSTQPVATSTATVDETRGSVTPPVETVNAETKKGKPGSKATYPNGLRDVHEIAAAAEALGVLSQDGHRAAERSLRSLLNPCTCKTTGKCKCCAPKRERSPSPRPRMSSITSGSGSVTPTGGAITESLTEMFQSKVTTNSQEATANPPPVGGDPSLNRTPSQRGRDTWAKLMSPAIPDLSPGNMHHPAHTSPHVHKTKLYSPYAKSGHVTPKHHKPEAMPTPRSGLPGIEASSSASVRLPPPRLRPLADMGTFLGAVFREDGSINESLPRSAFGLPGIKSFDAMAENGGVKIEPMEIEQDGPITFPTTEDMVIAACTCGSDCACPGCATHDNADRVSSQPHGENGHTCGESCKSCFNCAEHLSLPSGITSIAHLLSIAAANVPHPSHARSLELNAHDTRILPPAAQVNPEVAQSMGFVQLKPLECCNGRCQCPPGDCKCEQDCCGCCVRCTCDADGDTHMDEGTIAQAKSACCSGETAASVGTSSQPESSTSSPSKHAAPRAASPSVLSPHDISSALPLTTAPLTNGSQSCCSTAQPSTSGTATPPNAPSLRRASSTSQGPKSAQSGSSGRRATVTSNGGGVSRSASSGKSASKALALHTTPHHPRPILPKPSANGPALLTAPRGSGATTSRNPSPNNRTPSTSSVPSRTNSPILHTAPQSGAAAAPLPPPALTIPSLPPPPANDVTFVRNEDAPLDTTEFDTDLLAFIQQLSEGDADFSVIDPTLQQISAQQDFANGVLPSSNAPDDSQFPDELTATLLRGFSQPIVPSSEYTEPPMGALSYHNAGPQAILPSQVGPINGQMYDFFPNGIPDQPQWQQQQPFPITSYEQPSSSTSSTSPARLPAAHEAPPDNPNVIDLSKPLNPADVDRIIKALQMQQSRENLEQSSTLPPHQTPVYESAPPPLAPQPYNPPIQPQHQPLPKRPEQMFQPTFFEASFMPAPSSGSTTGGNSQSLDLENISCSSFDFIRANQGAPMGVEGMTWEQMQRMWASTEPPLGQSS